MERRKKHGKFNILDVFVLLVLIGLAAGTVYKFAGPAANIKSGKDKIHLSVKIQDVRELTAKYYEKGLEVYDSKTNTYIGKIESIAIAPFQDLMLMEDGSIVKADKPERIEITLEIVGDGVETEQSFMMGGTYEAKVGAGAYITTKYMDVSGWIENIWIE